MKAEYHQLKQLENHSGYQILMTLWAIQGQKILEASRRAAKKPNESSWRYYAGQQEGFELAITQLQRSLKDMEKDSENTEATVRTNEEIEELLGKIKSEGKANEE